MYVYICISVYMGLGHQRVFSGINFLPTWDQFSPFQYSEMFGFNHKDKERNLSIKSKRETFQKMETVESYSVHLFACESTNKA